MLVHERVLDPLSSTEVWSISSVIEVFRRHRQIDCVILATLRGVANIAHVFMPHYTCALLVWHLGHTGLYLANTCAILHSYKRLARRGGTILALYLLACKRMLVA